MGGGYVGIMEKKMETVLYGLGFRIRGLGFRAQVPAFRV